MSTDHCLAELPCFVSKKLLSEQQLSELPWTKLGHDWFGSAIIPPLSFLLAVDQAALWFAASREAPPACDLSLSPGTFIEGLWEQELAELFLCENAARDQKASARYQEFNLSPAGAWWSCSFSAYRVREADDKKDLSRLKNVTCWSSIDSSRWLAGMRIPKNFLSIEMDFSRPWRANVTGVLLAGTSPHYLTFGKLNSQQPDFHLSEQFPLVSQRT